MGLEHRDHSLPFTFTCSVDHRRHLAGQVRVVVDERDPVTLAPELEPPGHSTEGGERALHRVEGNAELDSDGGGAGRVGRVVAAGERELDVTEPYRRVARARIARRSRCRRSR